MAKEEIEDVFDNQLAVDIRSFCFNEMEYPISDSTRITAADFQKFKPDLYAILVSATTKVSSFK